MLADAPMPRDFGASLSAVGFVVKGLQDGSLPRVPVVDPELESIRLKCPDVTLVPTPLFDATLRAALAELRASNT